MKDDLGQRMKIYEGKYKDNLPKKSYVILRVDGKAFHTYARNLSKPFDRGLMEDMDATAVYLCKNIMGAKFAYVQSDEISVFLTDLPDDKTEAWFNNSIQKMASVGASMATRAFNEVRLNRLGSSLMDRWAEFDCRVLVVPIAEEVVNYFIWRQMDAIRNSVQMVARSIYSHKDCENKNTLDLRKMVEDIGGNWADYTLGELNGRIVTKEAIDYPDGTIRHRWASTGAEPFVKNRLIVSVHIPVRNTEGVVNAA